MRIRKWTAICLAVLTLGTVPTQAVAVMATAEAPVEEDGRIQTMAAWLGRFDYPDVAAYYDNAVASIAEATQTAKAVFGSDEWNAALAVLEAVTPAEAEVEMDPSKMGAIDWFGTVQHVFPRECDALVTDVDTGKSFYVRRTFGHNHADIEPLTAADAAIIKEIWGGEWSWERRAVVVQVEGYILAGSMTAFPHAGRDDMPAVAVCDNLSGGYGRGQNLDSVKGNGVDGHMDIHFLNSLTHGSNVKQKVHQDAVAKAAVYIESHYAALAKAAEK